jgi:putative peptide zinc metalloprotease protein
MTVVDTRVSVWEALAGRALGSTLGPVDAGLWQAVNERLNPALAKPVLRAGLEESTLTTARGVDYVMLRSPDGAQACYLRLTPEELALAKLMDGTRTVARLVAEFARIAGRLAPDQVRRVVADLAGNRMLEELPVDAFHRLQRMHRRPWPVRLGRALIATAQGRRVVLASIDPLVGLLYRAGGRLFFTRPVAILSGLVALAGLAVFVWTWLRGDQSVFLTSDSYVTGALVLLGLNVVALACHELGHALAAKHAGRRVPVAGFLVYFGIPSVFVDTTDVWMAGRRARIVTTAAGPATGLILAGITGLVGFFVPEAAPWTFKLAFAWYLNALFNLNPFLALDGYYLLMDWLEVPNLRARGMAWVVARLRRRPPRFGDLDREGRLVALYGMLAIAWLAIAANLAYRIYTDRVAGLVTGLWRAGWGARLLLAALVAGLAAPLVYVAFAWLRKRLRRLRERVVERRSARDAPRRLAVLRSSVLGQLPATALTDLADRARWVRPRTGEQLVFAGAAQPSVYLVVDGAVEARRPGDPTGSVRERVGAGGVIGLAGAVTGAPASLNWHTAGTTLLAMSPSDVANAVGPLSGPPLVERAELETLLLETPALQGLRDEDRLGLFAAAQPGMLAPGDRLHLNGADDVAVVSSGVLTFPGGVELRRGAVIGPYGEVLQRHVATARTPARIWVMPGVGGLPLLVGAGPAVDALSGGRAPSVGAHPPTSYPPLAAPPGPPPSSTGADVDSRFERKLWWLLILLLLFAVFLTGTNFFAGPVWAEMRSDQALLRVTHGAADVRSGGVRRTLPQDTKVYVREGDVVEVAARSTATLTFRGGSRTTLCAGTDVDLGRLRSDAGRRVRPSADLTLRDGRLLVDTQSTSKAFEALTLRIGTPEVVNEGLARYAVSPSATVVGTGSVYRAGRPLAVDPRADLTCGDGVALRRPGGTPTVERSVDPSRDPSPDPSVSRSPSSSPSVGNPRPGTSRTTRPPTRTRPPPPPVTTGPPAPSVTPPPANRPPTIAWVSRPSGLLDQRLGERICNGGTSTTSVSVSVTDELGGQTGITVVVSWSGFVSGSSNGSWRNGAWHGMVGPVLYPGSTNEGGSLTVTVVAYDDLQQASNQLTVPSAIRVRGCFTAP